MSLPATLLLALLAFGDAGPKGPRPADAASAPKAANPCSLLTSAVIQRVHHAKVLATKPSQSPSDGFTYSQCFYQTEKFAESVVLTITVPDKAQPTAATEFWKEKIVKASQTEVAEETPTTKASAKQHRHKPLAVAGLGDEAWWIGDRNAGALYVRRGERFFRVSVGGGGTKDVKTQQAIALARSVLARLD
jgi:hypothetical protein